MAQLKEEYTDIKGIKHHVTHQTIPHNDPADQEKMIEELLAALKKESGTMPPLRKRG